MKKKNERSRLFALYNYGYEYIAIMGSICGEWADCRKKTVQTATPSEAYWDTEDNEEIEEEKETSEDLESVLETDEKMDDELRETTPSEAEENQKMLLQSFLLK